MNVAKLKLIDVANGLGIRVSLYVSGCRAYCKGCFNVEAWNFSYGAPYTEDVENAILRQLEKPYIAGLSVLGGEPLEAENRDVLIDLLKKVKERYPNKPIWLYTGYTYEDVKDLEILKYVDILVDGRFILEKKDAKLKFRGSSNQRIIDVKTGELYHFTDYVEGK